MNKKKLRYCLIETIIIDFIIFIIFYRLSPVKDNFLTLNLHPLLIVTSMMALRYGNYLGLISATISSLVYVYVYYLLGKDLYIFLIDFSYYKFLLMFYLSAVILGRFKDNYEFRLKNMDLEFDLLKKSYDELHELYEKCTFIREQMKKQIIGAQYSIISLFEAASSLVKLNPEEVYTETLGILSKFLGARSISIYTVDDRQEYLRLKIKVGDFTEIRNSIKVDEDECYKLLVFEKKVIKHDINCQDDFPIMSAPLIKDDKVIAIINIDEMNFEEVTDYSYNLFKVIVEWINKALVSAIEIEEDINKDYYYDSTRIMKFDRFIQRLEEEKKRKSKFKLEYCLLAYKRNEIDLNILDINFRQILRKTDVIGYDDENDIVYVLLPATKTKNLDLINEKILNIFNYKLEFVDKINYL